MNSPQSADPNNTTLWRWEGDALYARPTQALDGQLDASQWMDDLRVQKLGGEVIVETLDGVECYRFTGPVARSMHLNLLRDVAEADGVAPSYRVHS